MPQRPIPLLAATPLAATAAGPALAHHPMGGAAPATAWEGLLSGLAHPVIGLDHLAFLVAAGVLAAAIPGRGGLQTLVACLAGSLVGALLHLGGLGLGPVELAVALTVLLAGAALLTPEARRLLGSPAGLALALAAAGLFHGHALAEAAAGAGPAPVTTYLLALGAMQAGIGFGVMAAVRCGAPGAAALGRRLTGIGVAAVGAFAFAAVIA